MLSNTYARCGFLPSQEIRDGAARCAEANPSSTTHHGLQMKPGLSTSLGPVERRYPDNATSRMATRPSATAARPSLMAPARRLGSSTRSPCPPNGVTSSW